MAREYWIGTSGWHYDHWRGRFYPERLPKDEWLRHYAREFPTAEINNSFYQLPRPATWRAWRNEVPDGFVFAVKAHRLITHQKKLKDGSGYLENFLEHAGLLGDRLGPILFQLPGTWHVNVERLASFVERLPAGRYVFEFRHESWLADEALAVLRARNVALCWHDMSDPDPPLIITADFAYVRFHGAHQEKYAGRYHGNTLRRWARRLRGLPRDVREVFIYFNNDYRAYAVENARTLRRLLGARPAPAAGRG